MATLPAVDYGFYEDDAVSFQTMPDGSSYVLRLSTDKQNNRSNEIYRLTSVGAIDSSFGSSGVRVVNTTGRYLRYRGLLVDESKRRIYLSGRDDVGPSIDAYRFDGTADTTFATGGHLSIESDSNGAAEYSSFDSTGRILVGIHSNKKPGPTIDTVEVARLSASGLLDASFGSGGISRIRFASTADYVNTNAPLELLPNGMIVVPFVKYSCTQDQNGNCTTAAPVGSGYVKFPAVGYATT